MWAEGVKGAEIHARLCTQYGQRTAKTKRIRVDRNA